MITFTNSEAKQLDKLLNFLFAKQAKYSLSENINNIDFNQIAVSSNELKNSLGCSDFEYNKRLQIFFNRNIESGKKFISIEDNKVWLMDLGIEFYYSGGFQRERKEQLIKRRYEMASIIFGVIATVGVLISIYMSFADSKRLDERIDNVEQGLINKIDKK